MALKKLTSRTIFIIGILLALFASVVLNPSTVLAMELAEATVFPTFSEFSTSVQDGRADLVRGVYVSNVLALPIVQQPYGHGSFLSEEPEAITQFRMASRYGTTGLLAHNYLAGASFFDLKVGDEVRLVYGDGKIEIFVVYEILRYQALQPHSTYSSFRDLDTDKVLSVEQTFKRVFFSDGNVTFQTCIEKDGELSWGRLFVIAIPKAEYESLAWLNE
ncbi:MAG: hypothetical protein MHPDNHAH_01225 [Anaerolineales bacterium]|nr:hypothetical protein [Anaerolineales bacterium]WKZ46608.1 MAG: hypothetical protein QY306_12395 [Anaerolineales bacterium]